MAVIRHITDRQAVLEAINECDRIGRKAFREKYAVDAKYELVLRHNGKPYDPEPLLAAAQSYQHPDLGPIKERIYQGHRGQRMAQRYAALGFQLAEQYSRSIGHDGGAGDSKASRGSVGSRASGDSAPPPAQRDWPEEDVRLIVADYFEMLKLEASGQEYSKAEHRRRLLASLDLRSEQSIEFKHCNISAVLSGLSLPYIEGYKPRTNVQGSLRTAVETFLNEHPQLFAELDRKLYLPVSNPPDGSQYTLKDIEEAAPVFVESEPSHPRSPTKFARPGLAEESAQARKALGIQGEEFVAGLERRFLRDLGRVDLAERVRNVAAVDGDGAGYDVRSFEIDGSEKYIEVKTTNGGDRTPFVITENELFQSERLGQYFWLYRIFRFSRGPKLYRLQGPLTDKLWLKPTEYSARPT